MLCFTCDADIAFICIVPREPVSFTKIAFDDGLYELSWKPPVDGDAEIRNYTIFWCENDRDRPYQCQVSALHTIPCKSLIDFS